MMMMMVVVVVVMAVVVMMTWDEMCQKRGKNPISLPERQSRK